MKPKKIMFIVAHPDDEVLGCGGTISKFISENLDVKVIILGEGSSCRYNYSKLKSDIVKKAIIKRNKLAKKSFEILGIKKFHFGKLFCGRFDQEPIIDIVKKIEKEINIFKPDTIFTHNLLDTNKDHRIVFDAVNIATRTFPRQVVKNLLTFEVLSSSEWRFIENFKPNYFIDISRYINTKIKAFDEYYVTEGKPFPFPRNAESIEVLSKYRGMQSGLKNAEAFQIIRIIE